MQSARPPGMFRQGIINRAKKMKTHKELFRALIDGHELTCVTNTHHKICLNDADMLRHYSDNGEDWTGIARELRDLNPKNWVIHYEH